MDDVTEIMQLALAWKRGLSDGTALKAKVTAMAGALAEAQQEILELKEIRMSLAERNAALFERQIKSDAAHKQLGADLAKPVGTIPFMHGGEMNGPNDKFNRDYGDVIISTQPIKALSGFAPMRDALWRRLWRWLVNALTGKEQKDG